MKYDLNEYQEDAKRTNADLGSQQINVIHMLLGLASEVGELQDAYKKNIAYGRPLDLVNVIEEIGDIKWYISNLCTILGISENKVAEINISKLKARYPEKFTEECATKRDLKKEREILEDK